MAPFDSPYTTFYWSAIVTLSCIIVERVILALNNTMTLKSGLQVTQGH